MIRASFAGDLQSISWMTMAFGGICGSLLGGYALTNLQIDKIFLLFSLLPTLQLLSCGLVEESTIDSKVLAEFSISESSIAGNGKMSKSYDRNFSREKSDTGTLRRKKSQKNIKKSPYNNGKFQIPEKGAPPLLQSLKMASYTLFRAFRQPIILR